MTQSNALRHRAEAEASRLPPLLARADHLAGTVLLGDHGRRRAGMGDDFWQYRPAQIGDSRRMIDHRRSARGDHQFVREREWQIAQSVMLWVDQGASMRFSSDTHLETKADRARLLGLGIAILLVRGGEVLRSLRLESKYDTSWSFLTELRDKGRAYAEDWLDRCQPLVGKQSSLDIHADFLSE